MSSLVYFKFKSNLTQQNIPFEGSAISVNDLKSAIRLKNGMKSNDFELILMTTDGKDYSEKDLIPAYSSVIVRRMPVYNFKPVNKTINPENFRRSDPYKLMRNIEDGRNYKIINLATSDMSEDQKEDFVAELSSKIYNFPKRSQTGPVPHNYLCNKCNIGGHWIKDCPGIADKDGNMLDSKTVKRPSGIPTTNLMEVDSTTPNSYLTADGRYVVNTMNHQAYLKGKKDKRPFSQEENPPRQVEINTKPACLVCNICDEIFRSPVSTPCCGKVFCKTCAIDAIFDDQSDSFHKCPNCNEDIEMFSSLVDQILLGEIINQWQIKKMSEGDIKAAVKKKEEEDDLTNEIFGFSDKENGAGKIMLVNENYVYAAKNEAEKMAMMAVISDKVTQNNAQMEEGCRGIPVVSVNRMGTMSYGGAESRFPSVGIGRSGRGRSRSRCYRARFRSLSRRRRRRGRRYSPQRRHIRHESVRKRSRSKSRDRRHKSEKKESNCDNQKNEVFSITVIDSHCKEDNHKSHNNNSADISNKNGIVRLKTDINKTKEKSKEVDEKSHKKEINGHSSNKERKRSKRSRSRSRVSKRISKDCQNLDKSVSQTKTDKAKECVRFEDECIKKDEQHQSNGTKESKTSEELTKVVKVSKINEGKSKSKTDNEKIGNKGESSSKHDRKSRNRSTKVKDKKKAEDIKQCEEMPHLIGNPEENNTDLKKGDNASKNPKITPIKSSLRVLKVDSQELKKPKTSIIKRDKSNHKSEGGTDKNKEIEDKTSVVKLTPKKVTEAKPTHLDESKISEMKLTPKKVTEAKLTHLDKSKVSEMKLTPKKVTEAKPTDLDNIKVINDNHNNDVECLVQTKKCINIEENSTVVNDTPNVSKDKRSKSTKKVTEKRKSASEKLDQDDRIIKKARIEDKDDKSVNDVARECISKSEGHIHRCKHKRKKDDSPSRKEKKTKKHGSISKPKNKCHKHRKRSSRRRSASSESSSTSRSVSRHRSGDTKKKHRRDKSGDRKRSRRRRRSSSSSSRSNSHNRKAGRSRDKKKRTRRDSRSSTKSESNRKRRGRSREKRKRSRRGSVSSTESDDHKRRSGKSRTRRKESRRRRRSSSSSTESEGHIRRSSKKRDKKKDRKRSRSSSGSHKKKRRSKKTNKTTKRKTKGKHMKKSKKSKQKKRHGD